MYAKCRISNVVRKYFWECWQRNGAASESMSAVTAKIKNTGRQDVVAHERECVATCIPRPFSGPLTIDKHTREALVLQAGGE
jgi:hypothetical protein